MHSQTIKTLLGNIAVYVDRVDDKPPLVLMHGMFVDHTLWAAHGSSTTGRSHIYIDMPAHGASANVAHAWSLDDCVTMLLEVLDTLKVNTCIGVGQSWGSMTLLRAASKYPQRFAGLVLCNMPFKGSTGMGRVGFSLQKLLVYMPRFYAKQAAKALYTASFISKSPELVQQMQDRLANRPGKQLAQVIDAVILNAQNVAHLCASLQVPALAVVGATDYVGEPPGIQAVIVPGGHVSPHEAPSETVDAIKQVIAMAGG